MMNMQDNNNNNNQDPPLCGNGCGFFGNRATRNLCSKCYKDALKQQLVSESKPKPNLIKPDPHESAAAEEKKKSKKEKKSRCDSCKKRVGLTGFECKCGGVYCGSHRYPEFHCCGFDFKESAKSVLAKTLFGDAENCKTDKLHYRM